VSAGQSSGDGIPALALNAAQREALAAAFPEVATRFPVQGERALEWLAQEDAWRRGGRDRVSGAWHRLALLQGALLKEDFDAGLHSGDGGWRLGAVLVDAVEFMPFNAAHGFTEGDQALRAMADSLRGAFPGGKVVRIHSDALAVLMGPTAETRLSAASEGVARAALQAAVARWKPELQFTVALLDLTLVSPSHHEVIGPLVWAECERALMARKRMPGHEVMARRIVLDALVPDPR
jgi:GGDEF domain-containing protein